MDRIAGLVMTTALALLIASTPAPAQAACTPDYAAWGWLEGAESMDDVMIAHWCGADAAVNAQHYWDSLQLGEEGEYWNNQAALEGGLNCSNPNTHLIRLYNAAAAIDATYANLTNQTLPHQASFALNWLAYFVHPRSQDGYTATCTCCGSPPCTQCTKRATNPSSSGSPTQLHYAFFWNLQAPVRGSTLVHEATHEDVHHLSDDACAAGGSCDDKYGNYNAQTVQMNFLDRAIRAYQKNPSTGELRVANYGEERCGYLPFMSPAARVQASDTIRTKLDLHFETGGTFGPPGMTFYASTEDLWDYDGNTWLVDTWENAFWRCDNLCQPGDYLPGGKHACNEDYQVGNAAINQVNYAACTTAQSSIQAGVTPSQWAQAQQAFFIANKDCIPGVSDAYLKQYCGGLSAGASNVGQIEAGWELPDQPGYFDSGEALTSCVRTYCDQKFSPTWINQARAACYEWDDPGYGCLDELCGDLETLKASKGASSLEYFLGVQCRRHYIENDGNSFAYFTEQEEDDSCIRRFVDCKNRKAFDTWVAARAAGTCSLASPGTTGWTASSEGRYQIAAARVVGSLSDWAAYQGMFESAKIDDCMALLNMCESSRELLAKISAEVVAGSSRPYNISTLLDKPNPSPWARYRSPVEANMRGLALLAVSSSTGGPFTAREAAHRLASSPEMQHALSLALGKENFFAGFGTRDLEPIFGTEALTRYASAAVTIEASAEAKVKEALTRLADFKKTRERCESKATADLLSAAAAKLTQAQLFGLVKSLANASSAAELEAALDQAAADIK